MGIKSFFMGHLLHISAAVIAGLVVYCVILNFQVMSRDVKIARQAGDLRVCGQSLRHQNSAIAQMRRDGERRQREQAEALRDARRQNERQSSTIESLRRSSVTPRVNDGTCEISETLRGAEGL